MLCDCKWNIISDSRKGFLQSNNSRSSKDYVECGINKNVMLLWKKIVIIFAA